MLSSSSIRRGLPALAVLVAAALTLGACGGGSDSSSTTTATTTSTTPTTPTTSSTTSGGSTTGGSTSASDLRSVFEDQLAKRFAQQGQVTQDQANCIIDKLRSTLSDQQILQAQQNPQAVQKAAANAALSCGVGQ
jgi:hypothetical protein